MPGIPFAVVRAVVPGLEFFQHDPARLGPRLLAALQGHIAPAAQARAAASDAARSGGVSGR
jgi:hypothetical protein